MASHEDQEMTSPWDEIYSPAGTPCQPPPGFENVNLANLVSGSSDPWVPFNTGTRTMREHMVAADQYNFRDYRSPCMPSDAGTFPSDSGFGGDAHRAPTTVTAPSVQGEDISLTAEAQHVENLMGDFHLEPSRTTQSAKMQPSKQAFACSECGEVFDKNSLLNKHLRKHNKPFKCKVSGCKHATKGFASIGDLKRHLHQVHHEPGNGKQYRCSHGECLRATPTKVWMRSDNFRNHVSSKHKIKLKAKDDLSQYEYMTERINEIARGSSLDGVGNGAAYEALRPRPDAVLETADQGQDRVQLPESGASSANHHESLQSDCNLLTRGNDLTTMQAGRALAGQQLDVPIFFRDATLTEYSKSPPPPPFQPVTQADGNFHDQSNFRKMPPEQNMLPTGGHAHAAYGQWCTPSSGPRLPVEVSLSLCTEATADTPEMYSSTRPSFTETPFSPNTSLSFNAPSIISTQEDATEGSLSFNISSILSPHGDGPDRYMPYADQGEERSTEAIADILDTIPTERLEKYLQERNARTNPNQPAPVGVSSSKPKTYNVCDTCGKVCKRPCELRKHKKRHERPYGCTVLGCDKRFGSKNDWKRHENTQHSGTVLDVWACDSKGCEDCIYLDRAAFEHHISSCDGILMDDSYIPSKVERCRIGRTDDLRFWCGFCREIITLTDISASVSQNNRKDMSRWSNRCDHIDDHLFGRNGLSQMDIHDWAFLENNCTTTATSSRRQDQDGEAAAQAYSSLMGGQHKQQSASRGRSASDSTALKTKPSSFGGRGRGGGGGGHAKRKGGGDQAPNTRPAKRAGESNPWQKSA